MADWSWPEGQTPAGPGSDPMLDLGDLASMFRQEAHFRVSPAPVPGLGLYDPATHLPYGHSTGQHVMDVAPADLAEERLRKLVAAEVIELLDTRNSDERREAALKTLVTGDVSRAMAMIAELVVTAWSIAEGQLGIPPHATVQALRDALEGK